MESIKNSAIKRILVFFCCTVVFISSVFMSYNNTLIVKAVDDADLLQDAAIVCLSGLGLVLSGPTAGAVVSILGPEMLALGKDVHDYVTQNEDGTTTISQDFILLVLDAYNQYRGEHYFDGTYEEDPTNKYFKYDAFSISLTSANGHIFTYRVSDFTNICQLAILKTYGGAISTNMAINTYVYANGGVIPINLLGTNIGYGVEPVIEHNKEGFSGSFNLSYPFFSLNDGSHIMFQTDCASIPIFESKAAMEAFLKGEGDASSAINYRNLSGYESSSYTGKYSGGDINIATEKLNGIQDKLNEINETDKSIDDKLKDILEWLGIDNGSGFAPGSTDFKGLLDMLSSYFNAVIIRLDAIIQGIDGLLWFESNDTDEDDPTNDLSDMLKKILDNPESGSQEVADSLSASFTDVASGLTRKFPFSIPWDIYGFFSVFANASASSPQAHVMTVSYDDRGFMLSSDYTGNGIQTYSDVSSTGGGSSGAPYFELPIFVESFGIDEVIVVDLEGFSSLSTFSRTMFSLIFGMLLIKWTIAFIGAINEVMPDFFSD